MNGKITAKSNKRKFLFRMLCSLAIMSLLLIYFTGMKATAAGLEMTITKSVDNETPYTGENFTYTIKYANPSTTENALDVVIRDVLPENIRYVSSVVNSDVVETNVTNDGTHDIVEFVFTPVLIAGQTGIIKITAKFPEGTTPETLSGSPNIAINTATIKPSNGDLVSSNPVTVTPKVKTPDWSIEKTKTIPVVTPALDQNVTYQIRVRSNSVVGGLDLKNVVITDTIPAGAEYISSSDGGTFDGTDVVWNLSSLAVGNVKNLYIVLKYPSETFDLSSMVTNNVLGTAKLYNDDPAPDKTSSVTHGFDTAIYAADTFVKGGRQSNDRYSVGQTARFYLGSIGNTGNVSFDSIEIIDNIPDEIELTQISTGNYSSHVSVQISYTTNLDSEWRTWTGSPFASPANSTLNVSALGLEIGEYVTKVRWVISDTDTGFIQPGFANTANIAVNGIVSMPAVGNKITNTAVLQAIKDAAPILTKNASKDIFVIDPMPWMVAQKTTSDGRQNYYYNETIQFVLRVKNHDYATGDYVDPIIVDTLPDEFEDVQFVSWTTNSSITVDPTFDASETRTIGSEDYTIIKSNITGTLEPGEYVDIIYSAKIKNLTLAGSLLNTVYVSTAANGTVYENPAGELIADVNDLDEDGSTTDKFVKAERKVFVNFVGTIASLCQIKGENDVNYEEGYYPNYTETVPGGIVDYRLTIKNSGSNGPITNLVLIDKLPNANDTGVIDTDERNTEWTPYLIDLITGIDGSLLPAGVEVYYSTVQNPSCIELNDPTGYTEDPADQWSQTPPVDITSVKSIKIEFNDLVLEKDEEIVIEWPMRAPVGAPSELKAWNSFGYGATYPDADSEGNDIQQAFLPSEPIKSGFMIDTPVPVNMGDFVWEDTDKDGIQDEGEEGINGVLVNLYRRDGDYSLVATTRTGNNFNGKSGYYLFPEMDSGVYKIEFIYPKTYTDGTGYISEYKISPYLAGSDITKDSDGDPSTQDVYMDMGVEKNTVSTADITVTTFDDLDVDLGLFRLGQIGDFVWNDKDADGIQDSGEPGIEGVDVELLDSAGNSLSPQVTTITDTNGKYLFENLEPGIYKVRFTIPDGYKLTSFDAGSNDTVDSDAVLDVSELTATSGLVDLESGGVDKTVDMGVYLGHIGNLVWNDLNANGIKDTANGTENGISGVTVKLYKDDVLSKTTTTNSSGIYSFDDLFPGNYTVEFIKPTAYNKFSPSTGTDKTVDNASDAVAATGITQSFSIDAGERINTIDAGMYIFAKIGNYVWNDFDADGIQDAGEPALSGITVSLTDSIGNSVIDGYGNPVADATTNASGVYTFTDLEPGQYKVVFHRPNDQYRFSPSKTGSNNSVDSDGVFADTSSDTAVTASITLNSNSNITTADQGMYLASIGDYVWTDKNANGIQDSGETGINNVKATLLDADTMLRAKDVNGVDVADLYTNASGYYRFENLGGGRYVVQFAMPTGYAKVSPRFATDADKDSNIDPAMLYSDVIELDAGEKDSTVDAGFYQYASVGDHIWEDADGDGIQDAGEPAIENVTVRLYDKNGTYLNVETQTDDTGYYAFTGLIPDGYIIEVIKPAGFNRITLKSQGSNLALDSDVDAVSGRSAVITLSSGEFNHDIDAGLYETCSVGDYVWEDTNGNGIQDGDEDAIENVTVKLLSSGGSTLFTTQTDENGLYLFDTLAPGTYQIEVTAPVGYDYTLKNQGSDDTKDSDITKATKRSDLFTLVSREDNRTLDSGLYRPASIGDFVWEDQDADGIQDEGETGIKDISVRLLDSSNNVLSTTVTDNDGLYKFDSLIPAAYKIEIVKPTGYNYAPRDAGSDDKDSDIDSSTNRSDPVTVLSGEENLTLDCGLYRYASVGDFLWEDVDADGIQDPGEPAIEGATVNLFDKDSHRLDMTITDGNGYYDFTALVPGGYFIEFEMPAGFEKISPKAQGSDIAADSDIDETTRKSDIFYLTSNEFNHDIDAGFYKTSSVGDFVWEDMDADGIQDDGEPAIENVTVKIFNNSGIKLSETLTDVNGLYLFDELEPGTYTVEIVAPEGYEYTLKNIGTDHEKDSDIIAATKRSDAFTLESDEYDDTIDCGLYRTAAIGDFIWEDKDADGIQDAGEIGIEDVTVKLLNNTGTQITEMKTDANGRYLFSGLTPSDYIIEISLPSGYEYSPKDQGMEDDKDSDIDSTTNKSDSVTLISGESDQTVDCGLYRRALIGDFVWEDMNADGVQDADETGIESVNVKLLDDGDNVLVETTTNENGLYKFDGLLPGNYKIMVTAPGGYKYSPKNSVSDDEKDNDIDNLTFTSDVITIISYEENLTVDCGLYRLASVGDFVWEDLNADGIQDDGEPTIEGATVHLLDINGDEITSTVTNSAGYYEFTGLVPSGYIISFDMPAGFDCVSPKSQGSDIAKDSDIDTSDRKSGITYLTSNEFNHDIDAGFYASCSVGDYVWDDTNADGIQEAGEPAIANVSVKLLDDNGTQLLETMTDANGLYLFDELKPGTYIIEIVSPEGYEYTFKNQGSDDDRDSDITAATKRSNAFTLISADVNLTVDCGLYRPAVIGDFVWEDRDADGIQDENEPGINNIVVRLLDDEGDTLSTAMTDENGGYLFDGLVPGTYMIKTGAPSDYEYSPKDAGSDDQKDSDIDSATDRSDLVTVLSGEENLSLDCGMFRRASIGDYIWEDMNADGIQDEGEKGIENAEVKLLDKDKNSIQTALTDEDGYYEFAGLLPDTYYIQFTLPSGFELISEKSQGTDTLKDSDADLTTLQSDAIVLYSNDKRMDIDAGFYRYASVGDTVWNDDNSNGIQNESSARGVNGVKVYLYDDNNNLIGQTVTASDADKPGKYSFSSLLPGNYYLKFEDLPAGCTASEPNAGIDDAKDSEPAPDTLTTEVFTLTSGQNDSTRDMGVIFHSNAAKMVGKTMGDQSEDTLKLDGDKEAFSYTISFDVPVNCVKVKLEDDLDNALEVLDTSNDIKMFFNETNVTDRFDISYAAKNGMVTITAKQPSELEAGRYTAVIECNIKDGFAKKNYPDDIIPNTAVVTINDTASMTNTVNVQPVYYRLGKIVWYDKNWDGIQNDGPMSGVNGVKAALYEADGTLVSTTYTANNDSGLPGYYEFTRLNPGEYYVQFSELPDRFIVTKKAQGTNTNVDSDVDGDTLMTVHFKLGADEPDNDQWDLGIYDPDFGPNTGDRGMYLIYLGLLILSMVFLIVIRKMMKYR